MGARFGVLPQPNGGTTIIVTDEQLQAESIAFCWDPARAHRLAHLLSLYGLVDTPFPDTSEGIPPA